MNKARAYLSAYRNKVSNKLFGVVRVPAQDVRKGDALLSYLTSPFTLAPGEFHTDPHASYWECTEIARLFSKRGYDVDIINWNNDSFAPKKKYSVVIDIQRNLERLAPMLPSSCVKIMHIVSSYAEFQNEAEAQRLAEVKKRRGAALSPRRAEKPTNNPAFADYLEGFGNAAVYATYAKFGKLIFPIRESASCLFDFPQNKDFAAAKKTFLWFGGGGAVHKGLDLVLEAFATLPDLTLHIVGPVAAEEDFVKAYEKELALPNVHLHGRPKIDANGFMTIDGAPFSDIADACGALVYLSASEGTSGAVVQAMHASLYPIITPESGIDSSAPSIAIAHPSVESVAAAIRAFSSLSSENIREKAKAAWSFARETYTKEQFTKTYSDFLDSIHI